MRRDDDLPGKLDLYSMTWVYMRAWAQREIQRAQVVNNSIKTPERLADFQRGRISLAKRLLDMENPPKDRGGPPLDEEVS